MTLGVIHAVLGIIILILAVVATVVEFARGTHSRKNVLRGPLVGLIDLQILLGIVTMIVKAQYGWFLIHPIIMIVAAALFHVWTKPKGDGRRRAASYLIGTILLIIGAVLVHKP